MNETKLVSTEISCDGCANAIKKAVGKLPGVAGVEVDVPTQTVTVTHDVSAAPKSAVTEAMEKAGFPVSG
jgi:copper chaperone CopZ